MLGKGEQRRGLNWPSDGPQNYNTTSFLFVVLWKVTYFICLACFIPQPRDVGANHR